MPPEPDKTTIIPSELGKLLATPQLERPTIVTPKIIEEGKEVVRPDVLQAVVQLAQLGQMVKIRKSLEKEEFEGKLDDRTLSATDQLQWEDLMQDWPNTPWATAFFVNDDLVNPVYIQVNDRSNRVIPLNAGETKRIDFTKADRRIDLIYYWCDAGNTATVRVEGKY